MLGVSSELSWALAALRVDLLGGGVSTLADQQAVQSVSATVQQAVSNRERQPGDSSRSKAAAVLVNSGGISAWVMRLQAGREHL